MSPGQAGKERACGLEACVFRLVSQEACFFRYGQFTEIEKLPEIGDNYDGRKVIAINEIGMDCEQPFDDNFNYDLYEIVCEDEDVNTVEWYVCVRKDV